MRLIAIIIALLAAGAAGGQIERVDIVGAGRPAEPQLTPPDTAGGSPGGRLALAGGGLALAAGAGCWAQRRWRRLTDAERAFLLLCLRRGVRHRERSRLRARAEAEGLSPIAALIRGGG